MRAFFNDTASALPVMSLLTWDWGRASLAAISTCVNPASLAAHRSLFGPFQSACRSALSFVRVNMPVTIAHRHISYKLKMSLHKNTPQAIDMGRLGVVMPTGYTSSVVVKDRPRTVGENVTAIRKRLGWSQVRLADALGIRQPSLWKIEHSPTPPETGTLLKHATALGVSVDVLLLGVSEAYDEKIAELVTSSDTQPGVSLGPPVLKSHADAPRGHSIAEPSHVSSPARPPLAVAGLLANFASDLHARADDLNDLIAELSRGIALASLARAGDTPKHVSRADKLRGRAVAGRKR